MTISLGRRMAAVILGLGLAGAAAAAHADDLKIRAAQCTPLRDPSAGDRYACQIDFVRAAAPEGRLYFPVVTIERRGDAWALLGGLCKSPA